MHRFFEALKNSKTMNLFFKAAGTSMESKARHILMNPDKILYGTDIRPGETVLEVGCGTGFFTLPAARLIGEHGRLVAMDALPAYVERASSKVGDAGLSNVTVIEGDALDTGLDSSCFDAIILFGVIPFPALPLGRLLPEMHRVLSPEGILAVWLWPPLVHFWVPKAIVKSGLFTFVNKHNGVFNYRPLP